MRQRNIILIMVVGGTLGSMGYNILTFDAGAIKTLIILCCVIFNDGDFWGKDS